MDEFSKALQATIQRATEFHQHLVREFLPNSIAFRLNWDPNVRPAIGYSFAQIGLQHLGGVLTLAGSGAFVSCLALLRPMIEAHVRGLWFLSIAADAEIEELSKARQRFRFPKFKSMVEAIAANNIELSKQLTGGEEWKDLCDYTHGGVLLIERSVLAEANSDKTRFRMIEAIRSGTKASGVSILLFVKNSGASATMLQFIRTLIREYLSDEDEHRHTLEKLEKTLRDEDLRQDFDSEVDWYVQRGDHRNKERYKEDPFEK
jgi:uncharacterized protein DUF6988